MHAKMSNILRMQKGGAHLAEIKNLADYLKSREELLPKSDSFAEFREKNGFSDLGAFSRAIGAAYSDYKKGLSKYEENYSDIAKKGLQNSGYEAYVNRLARSSLLGDVADINGKKESFLAKARSKYSEYLEEYREKRTRLIEDIRTRLMRSDVLSLKDGISYGVAAGLTYEEASEVAYSTYMIKKQDAFSDLFKTAVSFGMDKEQSYKLAVEWGLNEEDARLIADEIDEYIGRMWDTSESISRLESEADKISTTYNVYNNTKGKYDQ